MTHLPTEFPDFGLTPEQRRQAVRTHYYERPGMDGERGEIWCYSDRFSYRPGETVALHVSSTASSFGIAIVRDGGTETKVFDKAGIASRWQDTPDQCSVEGCGWEASFEFRVGDDWPSGAYRITLTADGRDGRPIHCHHLFIVSPLPGQQARPCAAGGGDGHLARLQHLGRLQPLRGHHRAGAQPVFAHRVYRSGPWCRGFVVLPKEAPRVPLEVAVPPKTVPRYPHMEWAFATGHSKKYTSSGWASYDSHFFRFAERAGYAVDLASQHDLHFSPEILDGYDCVVFVGHDEYWTWEMRDAVDAYVERGGHAARFAGNFMWQTRLEDEGRRQVCYKYRARAEDPAYRGGDVTRATNSWEAPEIGRPGSATFGLNATSGLYAGWGGCAPRGVRGFPVYRPEHWAFAGTGIYYGDLLGADSHVYGYEVDGLDFEIRGGLPYPTPTAARRTVCRSLPSAWPAQVEESADIPFEDQFLGDEDGRFTAETLFGEAERRQSGKSQTRQRHDRQLPARQGRGVPRRKLRVGRRPAAPRPDGRARDQKCSRPLSRKDLTC